MTKEEQKAVDEELGKRIRQIREARKMSQEKLAEGCGGITFQQIQKYEQGKNRVSFSRLIQISRTLNVDPATFLEGYRPDDGTETLSSVSLLTENKLLRDRLGKIRKLTTL